MLRCQGGQVGQLGSILGEAEDDLTRGRQHAELDVGGEGRHGRKIARNPEQNNGCLIDGFPFPIDLRVVILVLGPVRRFRNQN